MQNIILQKLKKWFGRIVASLVVAMPIKLRSVPIALVRNRMQKVAKSLEARYFLPNQKIRMLFLGRKG